MSLCQGGEIMPPPIKNVAVLERFLREEFSNIIFIYNMRQRDDAYV